MGNLIRAEFYRIRCQRWGFYGLTGSVLGGVVLLTLLCAFPPQNGDAALLFQTIEYSAIVGMVLAVPCADLASARVDGRQVLLKNEAVFGIPRWQMYLSRLFTALLLGVGLVAAMSLFALLLAGIFLPGIDQLPQILSQYALLMLTALPLWMASAGLFLCLKFIFRSGAAAGILVALYYLVGFPIAGAAATVVSTDTGEPGLISTLLYALHPMTPFWNGDMVVEGIDTGISIQLTGGLCGFAAAHAVLLGAGAAVAHWHLACGDHLSPEARAAVRFGRGTTGSMALHFLTAPLLRRGSSCAVGNGRRPGVPPLR